MGGWNKRIPSGLPGVVDTAVDKKPCLKQDRRWRLILKVVLWPSRMYHEKVPKLTQTNTFTHICLYVYTHARICTHTYTISGKNPWVLVFYDRQKLSGCISCRWLLWHNITSFMVQRTHRHFLRGWTSEAVLGFPEPESRSPQSQAPWNLWIELCLVFPYPVLQSSPA